MTVVAVTSPRSSAGATSLAVGLGMVWSSSGGRGLVVEADPGGGVLALRFGLPAEPSWTTANAALRRSPSAEALLACTLETDGLQVLPLPTNPLRAANALHRSASTVAGLLDQVSMPTVVDLGRLHPESPALPFVSAVDRVLIVFRPRLDEIQAALFTASMVRAAGGRPGLVAVGSRPHHPVEVADLADVRLVGVIPDDPRLAVAFSGGQYSTRKLRRSRLWRSVFAIGRSLHQSTRIKPDAVITNRTPLAGPPPMPPASEPTQFADPADGVARHAEPQGETLVIRSPVGQPPAQSATATDRVVLATRVQPAADPSLAAVAQPQAWPAPDPTTRTSSGWGRTADGER